MFPEKPGATRLIRLLPLVIVAAVLALAVPAQAGGHKEGNASAQISADRAADIARGATGGRVLKVERRGNVYQVRVLLDGERVRNLRVDASTGRVLN